MSPLLQRAAYFIYSIQRRDALGDAVLGKVPGVLSLACELRTHIGLDGGRAQLPHDTCDPGISR